MSLTLHRWSPAGHVAEAAPSPVHALASAWVRGKRTVTVLALPGESPRRPTRWEAEEARVLCTPAAAALFPTSLRAARLPRALDSDYRVPTRPRRAAPVLPFPWVIDGDRFPKLAPPPRAERETPRRPDEAERAVFEALLARGGPVWEREVALGPGWSSRRERAIRRARETLYLGHGLWALLGRDVPLGLSDLDALGAEAARALSRGAMPVAEVFARLREGGGAAARLDSPVYLAAVMRRRPEIVLDERSGYAALASSGRGHGPPRRLRLPPPAARPAGVPAPPG